MRNLALFVRYNGLPYCGSQVQKNALSVTETFQDAIEKVFGSRLDVKGCSRTDARVHANRFCYSMKTESSIPCERIVGALNRNLPPSIVVLSCCEMPEDFHARYSAKGKRYLYKILNTPIRDPFWDGFAYHHRYPLDEKLLDRAAKYFVGTYDFKAFCASGSDVADTVRTIFSFDVYREGELVYFAVSGNGFLYNMVRKMVATLMLVARGRLSPEGILSIIEGRDNTKTGPTMPPYGLYLDEVFYEQPDGLGQ